MNSSGLHRYFFRLQFPPGTDLGSSPTILTICGKKLIQVQCLRPALPYTSFTLHQLYPTPALPYTTFTLHHIYPTPHIDVSFVCRQAEYWWNSACNNVWLHSALVGFEWHTNEEVDSALPKRLWLHGVLILLYVLLYIYTADLALWSPLSNARATPCG
jgi:hypothetical protein